MYMYNTHTQTHTHTHTHTVHSPYLTGQEASGYSVSTRLRVLPQGRGKALEEAECVYVGQRQCKS